MKKKLKYQGNDADGIFWMPLNAFYLNFATSSINYIRPTFYYRSYKQTNIQQIGIKITSKFKNGFLMVGQKDHRHKNLPLNTPYSLCHLIGFVQSENKIL